MFVIVDIEWITNKSWLCFPTQMAAVKVDSEWNAEEYFCELIRPKSDKHLDFSNMAYTGYTEESSMYAKKAGTVFYEFSDWLGYGDVLLFWHKDAVSFFKRFFTIYLEKDMLPRTICLDEYVGKFLSGQPDSDGNAYKLAENRGIDVKRELMHYSLNDVRVMRELLKLIKLPQDFVIENVPSKAPVSPKKSGKVKNVAPPVYPSDFQYRYDPSTNKLHKKGCPLISGIEDKLIGYPSLKTPLKKRYIPCECCGKEFRKAKRERNADIIARGNTFNYVYSPNSDKFHKYSCGLILSANNILGARNYKTAAAGRVPCKVCNPTPFDEQRPLPIHEGPAFDINHVTKEERQAIMRQKIARRDRNSMLCGKSVSEAKRRDIYILTQPRFAFWAARGYQTFHKSDCPKLLGLSDYRGFATYKDALKAGLTPCRQCKPKAKDDVTISVPFFSKVRADDKVEDIEKMCNRAGFAHYREDGYFYLETPAGKWRMETDTAPIHIEHINLVRSPDETNYHKQPRLFLSFADVFNYIKRHDEQLMKEIRVNISAQEA